MIDTSRAPVRAIGVLAALGLTVVACGTQKTGSGTDNLRPMVASAKRGPDLRDQRLFASGAGWARTERRIYHSLDEGQSFVQVNPPLSQDQLLGGAAFTSGSEAFALGVTPSSSTRVSLYHTEDGGKNWQSTSVAINDRAVPVAGLHISAGSNVEYVTADVVGGTGVGSADYAARSTDGGNSWSALGPVPVADTVFVDAQHGFGVPAGGDARLYATEDGGTSWHDITADVTGDTVASLGQPVVTATGELLLPAMEPAGQGSVFTFYRSSDSGRSWSPTAPISLPAKSFHPDQVYISSAVRSAQSWVVTDGGTTYVTNDGGKNYASFPGPNVQVPITLSFGDANDAWLTFADRSCDGNAKQGGSCTDTYGLLVSNDGGRHWQEHDPPSS